MTAHRRPAADADAAQGTVRWLIACILLALSALAATPARAQISLVSVAAPSPASSAVTSITIGAPSGLAVGDVMLAAITYRGGSNVSISSVPSGWVLASSIDNSTVQGLRIYLKVAGASEASSYTWSMGSSAHAAGAIVALRGVDNISPVDASAIQTNGSSTSITAPTISPASTSTMLVGVFAPASGSPSVSPPSGMTEALEVTTAAGLSGVTLEAAYATLSSSGATGSKVAIASSAATSIGALVALRAASTGPSLQAFQNGGFELATVAPGTAVRLSAGDTRITGWTVIGNNIDYVGTSWIASDGNRSLDLAGDQSIGGVAQTFLTNAGSTYDVQFDLAGNPDGAPTIKPITVSAAGSSQSYTFDTSGRTGSSMGWTTQTFTFIATGPSTTLSFLTDTGSSCCWGPALDNVRVIERSAVTAGSFNAFDTSAASGSTSGVIQTKVAGTAFSLAIVSLNTARTAIDTTFVGTATVQLLDARDSTGSLDASGCRSSWVAISGAAATVTFGSGSAGRVTAALSEGNAWSDVRVKVTSGTGRTGCSTDNFAIRPAALVVTALDVDWRTAFTGSGSARTLNNASATGGAVHAAGSPFTLSATAVSSNGAAVSNYSGTPTVATGGIACALPAGCATGGLALPGWSVVGSGEMRATGVTYSEVGTFTLALEDTTFAAVDAADTAAAQRTIAQQAGTLTVGRFVPFTYELQPTGAAPQLRTFNATDASCSAAPTGTPRRSFTHVGQAFGFAVRPTAMILPRNAAGTTTTNYRGVLWKLTSDHITRQLDASNTTPSSQPVSVSIGGVAPADVISNSDGTGTVTTSPLDSITYTRNSTTPQAPFTANITTAVWITDITEDGVTGNPATIGSSQTRACFNGGGTCSVPGSGIAFDSAVSGFAGNEFRHGRLRLINGNGSELIALPVPMQAEYWSGSTWVPNTRDYCTTVSTTHLTLSNYQRNLNAGETTPAIAGPLVAGKRSVVFSAPGAGNAGSVDVTLNLGAGGANLTWLQGAWTTTTYDQNPTARATFGTLAAPSQLIFRRERF